MNYRERMRKAVKCPQFGNLDYGEWGTLNLNQRRDIKRLLDEMDRADEYIKTLYFKNENLQSKIDKATEYINTIKNNTPSSTRKDFAKMILLNYELLLDILKEDK